MSLICKVLNYLLYHCHQTLNILKKQTTKEDPLRFPGFHREPVIISFTIPNYYYDCLGNLNFGYTLKTTNDFHYLLLIPREFMLQGHMVPELGLHTSHVLSNIIWNTFGLLLEGRNQRKLCYFLLPSQTHYKPTLIILCSATHTAQLRTSWVTQLW